MMKMFSGGSRSLVQKLHDLSPTISNITQLTGMAGLSLGVMQHGQIIYQTNFGYRDVAARIPPNENTTYVIGSLTKGFTASMTGILVDEGKIDWTTMLREVVPDYTRHTSDPALNVTISDLLSHRAGFPSLDALWVLSEGGVALTHKDVIKLLSEVPAVMPPRSGFLYNNFAYDAMSQVIENVSKTSYESFLRDRILVPLGMNHTYFTSPRPDMDNAAKAYGCLLNMTHVEIPRPLEGEDVAMGAAGGVRSSVSDLLKWDKAILDAAHIQYLAAGKLDQEEADQEPPVYSMQGNPLRQLPEVLTAKISLPQPVSYREHSYALGWTRAQLPQNLGIPGTEYVTVGRGSGCSASRTLLYHEGDIPGFHSFHALLPEENSAIVVLANAIGLAEPTKLIGALLLETLLDNPVNTTATLATAQASANRGRKLASNVHNRLQERKNLTTPIQPLEAYTGRYHHPIIDNYFIDVTIRQNSLQASFIGREEDTYILQPYQENSFFWSLSHDQAVSKGLYMWDSEYYILRFGCPDHDDSHDHHFSGKTPTSTGISSAMKDTRCLRWQYQKDIFRTKTSARPNTDPRPKPSLGPAGIHGPRRQSPIETDPRSWYSALAESLTRFFVQL